MKSRKSTTPHDSFFKRTFSRLAAAAEFMRRHLPGPIVALLNLATLTLESESFVDAKLRRHFSDLLFRVGLKNGGTAYVFLLLEHKSMPDEWVALQLLRYLTQVWERLRRGGIKKLPLIIPIVIYHGPTPWSVGRKFSDLFEDRELAREWLIFLPDFEYYVCDLSQYRDEDLVGEGDLAASLRLLKYALRPELKQQLPDIFREALANLSEAEVKERIERLSDSLLGKYGQNLQ